MGRVRHQNFANFRQNRLFSAGDKTTVFQNDRFDNPEKSVVSIKFPPVLLGAAPVLWAPGIFWFFLLENPHAHKIPPFRGGGGSGFFQKGGGGGSANFIFMGVGIFFRNFLDVSEKPKCLSGGFPKRASTGGWDGWW